MLPNLILLLGDDMGRNDVGYNDPTVITPTMDSLAMGGVRLDTVYTWNWCAPSRASLLSGRYPARHGFEEGGDGGADTNALPLEFKLLPELLKLKDYKTVMAGKWHLGYPTKAHLPGSRGFDEYLGYLTGAEDYYTHVKSPVKACAGTADLWKSSGKGTVNETKMSRPANESKFFPQYSTFIFTDYLVKQIEEHNSSHPMFMYASYQGVHGPLEVPKRFFDLYQDQGAGEGDCTWEAYTKAGSKGFECKGAEVSPSNLPGASSLKGGNCFCNRLIVKAQMSSLDEAIANVTLALKAKGMWNNSVLVIQGDNGGPTFEGHSNTPLRGGKLNFFEGGIRPAALVHSPLLPITAVGRWYNGTIHETDWRSTFLALAGINETEVDHTPNLPDGINVWPALMALRSIHSGVASGVTSAPRSEVLIADHILRVGEYKLVQGGDHKDESRNALLRDCMVGTGGGWLTPPTVAGDGAQSKCPYDVYTRPPGTDLKKQSQSLCCNNDKDNNGGIGKSLCKPVTSDVDKWLCSGGDPDNKPSKTIGPCNPQTPCLYNLQQDPGERENLWKGNQTTLEHLQVIKSMSARLRVLQADFYHDEYNKSQLVDNGKFCEVAAARGSFCGPWLDADV